MKSYKNIDTPIDWRNILTALTNNQIALLNHPNGDFILGWQHGSSFTIKQSKYDAIALEKYLSINSSNYVFGYLSYDIKNEQTRAIGIKNDDRKFNDVHFFSAKNVLIKRGDSQLYFGDLSLDEVNQLILSSNKNPVHSKEKLGSIELNAQTNRKDYLSKIKQIKNNIQYGNIYEMNFCMNFKNTFESFNPVLTYFKLFENSTAPFASFFKDNDNCILSASPERFLKKKRTNLISQPIKGTAKRGNTKIEDNKIATELKNDSKELAENVMIVDLVRNDFSKIATKNSVNVSELCKIYSFKTVHQLISTVNCQIKENTSFTDILEATFPMGSMTGAPKISAMKIIDEFEAFSRGIYSGAIGYFDPNGNYDFNVVIRSILANTASKTISCSVGGAITIQSNPEKEYEECLLKLSAIAKTLC